jgi:hypothetical protein
MSTHTEHHDDHDEEPFDPVAHAAALKAGYELRDMDFWKLGMIGINGFFLFTAVVGFGGAFALMFTIHKFLAATEKPMMESAMTAPKNPPRIMPLQTNVTTWKDMQDLREAEAKKTKDYAPKKDQPGMMQIPVERAMEMVAEKGSKAISVETAK